MRLSPARPQDGVETGNLIEGNLVIYTRVSDALLNTDTTPTSFWITHPNNTVRHNRAAGSEAYGFWYRFLDNPEGESEAVPCLAVPACICEWLDRAEGGTARTKMSGVGRVLMYDAPMGICLV